MYNSSNLFWSILQLTNTFEWASQSNLLLPSSTVLTAIWLMPSTWGLGSAQLSCFGGIWSCIDDIELEWVTADFALATVCWKGVKWRASTWASWPLPAERKGRGIRRGGCRDPVCQELVSKFQGWVNKAFSSAWNPVIKTGMVSSLITLHPFPYPLKLLCVCHTLILLHAHSSFQILKVWDCTLLRGGMYKILPVPRHPCDHLCSQQHWGYERSIVCCFTLHGQLTSFPINQMCCLPNLS